MKALSGINPFGNHPGLSNAVYHQGLPQHPRAFHVSPTWQLASSLSSLKPKKEHYKCNPLKVSSLPSYRSHISKGVFW